jgi:plastocyanin
VKRIGLIVVGFALAAFMALPTPPLPTGPDEAAAAECVWQRHTKRIVKHVRRHGKLRKVVRKRHRWTCVAQPTAPAIVPPAPAPIPIPPAPEPEPEANRLSVKSAEYYFNLSRPTVRAGEVTIELNNRGEDPHNLNLHQEGDEGAPLEIPETESLQRSVATFDLPAGSYRLWCSLPEHEEKGMYSTLVVE